jgi:glycosyltransferase involved in cell wall biosynthesis
MSEVQPLSGSRILLLADFGEWGGTRTYVEQLLDFYRNHGACIVLVSRNEDVDGRMTSLVDELGFTYLRYSEIVLHPKRESVGESSMARARRLLSAAAERRCFRDFVATNGIDLVVVSAGQPGAFLGALSASSRSIYILHTYPHGWKHRWLGRFIFPRMIPKTASIVTVSDFARLEITKRWHLEERANPVQRIYSTVGLAVGVNGSGGSPLQVLTVGDTEAYKNPFAWIEMAVSVAESLPRGFVRFTWVGSGSLLDECRRRALVLSDSVEIEFVGLSSSAQRYYERSDVYVQLSSVENLSLAVLDALRIGMPCVVTDVGGLPEIVDHGVNGFVVSNRPGESAPDLLTRLLNDPQLRIDMGRQASEKYMNVFSPEMWDREMVRLHEQSD